jgi:hypothetical protein
VGIDPKINPAAAAAPASEAVSKDGETVFRLGKEHEGG